ncbi:MAG: GNAT family N-acetyltransferase [Terriglobales bacterium]
MELRPLTLADLAAVHALDQRCFPPGIAYSAAEITAYLRMPGFHCGCGQEGLEGVLLSVLSRARGHIITVDVEASARRKGIGRQMMRAAESYYRDRGAKGMCLEAAVNNAPALAFYARLGYRIVRTLRGYYAADLDALRLELNF